jgi:hypothetical protein
MRVPSNLIMRVPEEFGSRCRTTPCINAPLKDLGFSLPWRKSRHPAWHGSRGWVDACWLEEQTDLSLRQERLASSGSPLINVPNQPMSARYASSAEPPLPSRAARLQRSSRGPKAVVYPKPSPASLQEPRHRAPDATGARGGPRTPTPRSSQHTTSSDHEVKQTRADTAARVESTGMRYVTDSL